LTNHWAFISQWESTVLWVDMTAGINMEWGLQSQVILVRAGQLGK